MQYFKTILCADSPGRAMLQLYNLSRKEASCSDLLSCVFGLKDFEESLIYVLAREGRATLDSLASLTGRDRSTVHRALSKLMSLGICYRETVTLREGGYMHEYALLDVESISSGIRGRVEELKRSLDRLASNFEEDIRRRTMSRITLD